MQYVLEYHCNPLKLTIEQPGKPAPGPLGADITIDFSISRVGHPKLPIYSLEANSIQLLNEEQHYWQLRS